MKRVKKVPKKCANPLFEKWLIEWRDEARAKSSPIEIHFTKAIVSLQKYPLPLETGRDCILLQNFGSKLCAMLDKKLKNHLAAKKNPHSSDSEIANRNNDILSDISPKNSKSQNENSVNITEDKKKKFIPKRKKPIAFRRSREHSMSPSASSCGNDSPIIDRIHNINDEIGSKDSSEDDAAKKKSKVTKNLQKERLVVDNYSDDVPDVHAADTEEILVIDQFQMAPNSFDVFLLVDIHETAGAKTKAKNDATISELDSLKTQYEVRHLKVGDFGWIARCRNTKRELVLPYLVERKRMDDLASSIKDGRFHEQKFRLKQCGIPNIIYLLESHGKNQHLGLPLETLLQASTNVYVQDGFQTKFTDNHSHSMQYLSTLTTHIEKMFKEKHLVSSTKENLDNDFISKNKVPLMEFKQFNKAASKTKTFTVKEMFVKHLLQLKGISVEKALAIVEIYPTPIILLEAFQSAGNGADKLLASIKVGTLKRQLGPALSKTIYELYTRNTLD